MRKTISLILGMAIIPAMWGNSPMGVVKARPDVSTVKFTNDAGGRLHAEFGQAPSVGQHAEVSEETVTLTVVVDPDSEGDATGGRVSVVSEDGVKYYFGERMDDSVTEFELPRGTYIAVASFAKNGMEIVFVPDLEMTTSREVHVCRDQARFPLTTEWLLPDGNKAELPIVDNNGTTLNDPTITYLSAQATVGYKGISPVRAIYTMDHSDVPLDRIMRMATNLNTPDMRFEWLLTGGNSNAYYIAMLIGYGDETGDKSVVSNDPSKYYKPVANFQPTPQVLPELQKQSVGISVYDNDVMILGANTAGLPENMDFYATDDWDTAPAAHTLITLGQCELNSDGLAVGVESPMIAMSGDEQWFYAGIGTDFQMLNRDYRQINPTNPRFSYSSESRPIFGNTAASLEVGLLDVSWVEDPFRMPFPACGYGFYGEKRGIDRNFVTFEVHKGSELIGRGTIDELIPWGMEWSGKKDDAELVYTFTNNNISVDGIEGYGVCKNKYDPKRECSSCSMLQRVMLRDKDGNVGIKFEKPDGVMLTMAGGIARIMSVVYESAYEEVDYRYFGLSDGDIKVEYAPMESESYHEIAANHVPTAYFPGFGEFWEVPLEQVSMASPTGWFDLRVTITDSQGCYQEQTMSPAFYIESLAALETAFSGESATPCYFNLQGMPVANPEQGSVVIERVGNSVRKIVAGAH